MEWQSPLVFFPGESHGRRSLAGYSLWGHKESDMTDQLTHKFYFCKKKKKKVIGILIGIALNQAILLGSDILILNLLTMSMICVSTILWLIILSAMSYNLFTSLLPLWLTPKYFFFMLLSVELFHNFPFKLFIVNVQKYNWFFFVLTLSPTNLLKFIVSNSYYLCLFCFAESLRFYTCKILSSTNRKDFTSSFIIWMPLISFSCLIALARTSTEVKTVQLK